MAEVAKISRRSTRLFMEEHDMEETQALDARRDRISIEEKDRARDATQRTSRSSTNSLERRSGPVIPAVDLGKDVADLFPRTMEDMGKQVTKSLKAVKDLAEDRIDGRPINFGTVIANKIYRSSFPGKEDFEFMKTLGLKTIVSLVQKDFDAEFKTFMTENGINHCVINMDGTKKVAIPPATMQSIMEVVLDESNHPVLIHCNHGKHRTGCAVAVIRLVAGWNVEEIITEYTGHAEPKVRECDLSYIRAYQISSLEGLFNEETPTPTCITSRKTRSNMFRLAVGSTTAMLIWITTYTSFAK